MKITKTLEWDMGHRIPNHKSKCKNPHGHRYKIEVTLEGHLNDIEGNTSQGMVVDFSDIKKILVQEIDGRCDHSFMYYKNDVIMSKFFKKNPELKNVKVEFIPTAENISEWLFRNLYSKFKNILGKDIQLVKIKLWETPTSTSIIRIEDVKNL